MKKMEGSGLSVKQQKDTPVVCIPFFIVRCSTPRPVNL